MESVQVEIFGQTYSIKGATGPEHIKQLASFVDAKMREVQRGTGTIEPHRVAILTALTISEELHQVREKLRTFEVSTDKALHRLLKMTEGRQ